MISEQALELLARINAGVFLFYAMPIEPTLCCEHEATRQAATDSRSPRAPCRDGAAEASSLRDLGHALGTRDVAERGFQQFGVAVLEYGIEIGRASQRVVLRAMSSSLNLLCQFEGARNIALVLSRKWLEFEGDVISGLFTQPESARQRRWRSHHGKRYQGTGRRGDRRKAFRQLV